MLFPVEQAGSRSGRNCCDQVLALTNHIENGFQRKLKTTVVLVDLAAAYDTVWKKGLLYKHSSVIPCFTVINLIQNMVSNRRIIVSLGDKNSNPQTIRNELPQGSVLAPTLLNLYISDLPETMGVAVQSDSIQEEADALTEDLTTLVNYFKKWRLIPNPGKSEWWTFHLTNSLTSQEPIIFFGDTKSN